MAQQTDSPPAQPWTRRVEHETFAPADVERMLREHHDRADRRAKHWRIFVAVLPLIWGLVYAVIFAALKNAQ